MCKGAGTRQSMALSGPAGQCRQLKAEMWARAEPGETGEWEGAAP